VYTALLRSVKLSRPTQWLSRAPKAIKDGRRQSAVKKAHMAKFKGTRKEEAKVHKVSKTPSQAQAESLSLEEMDDVTQEGQEKEHEEEQQEEQEGECQEDESETVEKDETNLSQRQHYHFGKSLPEAPRVVQEAVQKVRGQPKRSGKQKQLADMARAYAMQKWDHKLFKSLQQERPNAKEDIAMPKVIMVAKKVGKSASEQAPCLVNSSILSSLQIVCLFLHVRLHWHCLGIG
jgi:hypothetical protein